MSYSDLTGLSLAELSQRAKKIGHGTGRTVFDLGNGAIVKVARNEKGYAQNKNEIELFHSLPDYELLKDFLCPLFMTTNELW